MGDGKKMKEIHQEFLTGERGFVISISFFSLIPV